MTFNKKTAVILFNHGGPDNLEKIKPYLLKLFNDKSINPLPQPFRFLLAKLISIKKEKSIKEIYANIGGKSPQLDLTISQADFLEKELSFFGNFKVFTVMRYSNPFAKDVIKKVSNYEPDEIIMLPLYPQFSSAITGSSIKDFSNIIKQNKESFKGNIKIKTLCCYPTEIGFIKSHARLITKAISRNYKDNLGDFRFLFYSHAIPQKLLDKGDPYIYQLSKTIKGVVSSLATNLKVKEEEIDSQLCFQSKNSINKWSTPTFDQELKRTAFDNKIPVIIPISFVCDDAQTLFDLDIKYKEEASRLGIANYIRVPALNSDGNFINCLVEICKKIDKNNDCNIFSSCSPKKMKLCLNSNAT